MQKQQSQVAVAKQHSQVEIDEGIAQTEEPKNTRSTTKYNKKVTGAIVLIVVCVAVLAVKSGVGRSKQNHMNSRQIDEHVPASDPSESSKCCDRRKEPGRFGNPFCLGDHKCCPRNGKWVCSNGGLPPTYPCGGVDGDFGVPCSEELAIEDTMCCDPGEEPNGRNGNPTCSGGASCCSNGRWTCNNSDGSISSSCGGEVSALTKGLGRVCNSCDPDKRPDGRNGNPMCIEGSTCCADGYWACNHGDGSSSCDGKTGAACCDLYDRPNGRIGKPTCLTGASCCLDGKWKCNNSDGSVSCEVLTTNQGLGRVCNSCDPDKRPDGRSGNPICIEGSTCCSDGNWACNHGDGSSSCDGNTVLRRWQLDM